MKTNVEETVIVDGKVYQYSDLVMDGSKPSECLGKYLLKDGAVPISLDGDDWNLEDANGYL